MRYIDIKIPVKPHIRKFLIKNFGDNPKIGNSDLPGMMIALLLSKQSMRYEEQYNREVYPTHYTMQLPLYLYERWGLDSFLTAESVVRFNAFFEGVYKLFEVSCVRCMMDYHPKTEKQARELFFNFFDLDEFDIADETSKKSIQRYQWRGAVPKLKLYQNQFQPQN